MYRIRFKSKLKNISDEREWERLNSSLNKCGTIDGDSTMQCGVEGGGRQINQITFPASIEKS